MECLFGNFSYVLKGQDGLSRVIARDEKSSFLSKHLPQYGGTGTYAGHSVGRLLRNIIFSGKGLVRQPANPDSIIIDPSSTEPIVPAKTEASTDISQFFEGQVYSTSATLESQSNSTKEETTMAVEVNVLEKQLEAARAEIDALKTSLKDNDIKSVQATASALTAELAATKVDLAKFMANETRFGILKNVAPDRAADLGMKAQAQVRLHYALYQHLAAPPAVSTNGHGTPAPAAPTPSPIASNPTPARA